MQNTINEKVIVITGAGGGIGYAIAENLSKHNVKLVLLGGRNVSSLEKTKNTVVKNGSSCTVINGDLTDMGFINDSLKKILSVYSKIDVLINNAGLAINCPFENVSEKQFDDIMALNLKTPFFLTQRLLPELKKSNYGTVINIASVVGHLGYPLQSPYAASKHGLIGFSKSLANEVYKQGVRVHVISPGGVYTDMVKISRPDLSPDGMIMPEDVAKTVEFLLTNRTNAVVDEILLHRSGKEPFCV